MWKGKYDQEPDDGEIPTPFPGDVQPPSGEATTLLQQTNPLPVLTEVENTLRGNVYDYQNEKWIPKYNPVMNDIGINKVMVQLKGIVNTNCILSNLTVKDVYMITHELANSITLDLCANYKEYALSKSDFDRVIDLCTFMCFFALRRGYLEGERHFLKTAYKSSETIIQKPNNEPQWSWSPFKKRTT